MRILGIDPGLAKTGWGIVDGEGQRLKLLSYGTIQTKTGNTLESRIFNIIEEFETLIDRYNPTDVSIEDIFFYKNVSSAISIAKVIGALSVSALKHSLNVSFFTPLQIKTALTGVGRAEKSQIQEMVKILLSLEKIPAPDHAADAIAAGICYYNHMISSARLRNR